tara:strand:- start:185 stop:403 length:219 start_codon:yes stop_codon:yes gene_type:complete
MKNLLYKALLSHYNAQKDEANAIIETYLQKSVGIGEHSNILGELKKWTATLAEADEALQILEKYFKEKGEFK